MTDTECVPRKSENFQPNTLWYTSYLQIEKHINIYSSMSDSLNMYILINSNVWGIISSITKVLYLVRTYVCTIHHRTDL